MQVGVFLRAHEVDRRDTARTADAQTGFASDVQSGQLSTEDAFETRWTKQKPYGAELHYVSRGNDYFVTLTASGPSSRSNISTSQAAKLRPTEPPSAYARLGHK